MRLDNLLRRLSLVWFVAAAATVAFGTPLACNDASLQGTDVSGITCTSGPLTFSNFSYLNAANDPNPLITLVGTSTSGSNYSITFSPNLSGTVTQDLHFTFEVTSTLPIIQVSGMNGGVNSSIQETVCDASVILLTGGCSDGQGGVLGALVSNDQTDTTATLSTPSTAIFIYKDILVNSGGHNSAFTQDFLVSSVPEPVSFSLMGIGLLGLGLLGRRRFGK
jgi:hypothetical protein